jgi:hypothetical protein
MDLAWSEGRIGHALRLFAIRKFAYSGMAKVEKMSVTWIETLLSRLSEVSQ